MTNVSMRTIDSMQVMLSFDLIAGVDNTGMSCASYKDWEMTTVRKPSCQKIINRQWFSEYIHVTTMYSERDSDCLFAFAIWVLNVKCANITACWLDHRKPETLKWLVCNHCVKLLLQKQCLELKKTPCYLRWPSFQVPDLSHTNIFR